MSDERVSRAVSTSMQAPEAMLRSVFEAVYEYLDTKDLEALTSFATAAAATVRVHASPGYEQALAMAPTTSGAPGRALEEIFAAHAPRQ